MTGIVYQPDTTYTLTSDINAASLLQLIVLSNTGVGIGLTNGGSLLSSTIIPSSALATLTFLGNMNYQLSLQYTTGNVAPSGELGIRLLDTPQQLLTANLFQTVSFDNVRLDAIPRAPEPAAFALMGLGAAGLLAFFRLRRRFEL